VVSPIGRLLSWLKGLRPASEDRAEFALGGNVAPIGLGVAGAVAVNTGPIGMRGLGGGADILDTVALPPNIEVVAANGAWAGVGALNMQVLSNDVNSRGERLDPLVIEAMLNDAMVRACVDTRKLKMLCGELRFHPSVEDIDEDDPDPSKADPKVARWAADFCKRAHDNMATPIPVWAWGFSEYLVYGHKVAEKVLEPVLEGPDAGLYYLKDLKIKGRWSYHLATDPFYNPVAVYAQTAWGPAYIAWNHFFVMSNQPLDSDPRGTSILKGAREAWRRKQRRLFSQCKGDDQFGTPSIKMKLAPNTPVESQRKRRDGTPMTTVEASKETLEEFANGGSIVIPDGAEVDVIESGRDGSQLVNAINYDDREMARAILNTNGAGILEPEHYTQGNGEHAQSKERGLADFDRDAFVANVRHQVFHYLLEMCLGRKFADMYTPRITLGEMFVDDFLKLANPLALMGQAGLLYQSQLNYLMAQAGFPRPKKGELRIGPSGLVPNEVPEKPAPAGAPAKKSEAA
jgi:hypothetical protein